MMNAKEIVQAMYDKDAFSQWLGISIDQVEPGYAEISMTVRDEMVNGFRIAHGGISFSLADSAFAFASNSRGKHAVSIDINISHLKAVQIGDKLVAKTEEVKLGKSTAKYLVKVWNQQEDLVTLFTGTVYRLDTLWEKA